MKERIIIRNLFLLCLFLSGSILFGQTTVTGVVKDAGGPLPMVNINVKGTDKHLATDMDGSFTIKDLDSNAILVFSYMGFKTKEVPVAGKTSLEVVMDLEDNTLSEVVIVGYVGQKKNSLSSAITQVNMDNLEKTKTPDVSQSLQGQVAGVFVAASTGAPGDGIKIRIRGEGTLGNNDVLYVVDGVSTRDITFLNPADIKTMTVLKDAAAGAIYGSRAAGGVILITTKSGKQGVSSITADYYSGIYRAANLPNMLNADQYLTQQDQAWHNTAANDGLGISPYERDRSRTDLADTDWLDELFTTGFSQNYQVSISGGTEKMQYLLSGGYYGMNGIIVGDKDTYQRINFRVNVNAEFSDRFKVGTNFQVSEVQQDKLSSSGDAPGIIRHALLRPPVLSVYKSPSDPTYNPKDPYTDLPFYTGPNDGWSKDYEYTSNPIAIVNYTDDKRKTYQNFGNVYGEYSFLEDNSLKFKTSLGADIYFTHNKTFAENYGDPNIGDVNSEFYGQGRQNRPNSLNENRGESMTFTFSNTLNYVKLFNDVHSVNFLLGAESISNTESAIGGARTRYDNTSSNFRYLDYGSVTDIYSSGAASSWSLLSYFASGTYGYNEKYFLTGTIRADASSRFGPNNHWGYFPSFSAGWVVTQEKFMEKTDWISNLKLRASWGQSGNQEIPNDAFQTMVTNSGGTVNIIRYGNPDLKWETTTQTNFGLDLSLFQNKFSFTIDYFDKTTDDILLAITLPAVSVGVIQPTYVNAGSITNKGFEYAASYRGKIGEDFKYNIGGNLATLDNNVNELQAYLPQIIDEKSHTITKAGLPMNSYYGYKFIGIYQNQAEINSYLHSNTNGVKPGDMKFMDVNGDGEINQNDRTIIGNSVPGITYGINFSAEYKNFDLSFLFQGVSDVDRYNDLKQILNYDSRPFNSTTESLDGWHGEGTTNSQPRNTFENNGGGQVSSAFIEDASYLRLKNIELGFKFDAEKFKMQNLRLYISAQNLLTFTNYNGLDPESTALLDQGTYPQSQSFLIGIQAKF
ncbi:TonB-dependent receptor [Flavobacterium sp.]|uniref:SusC/RagA family TonB-linked outer membrane protein n=1 Tax=Flavobacterium sp. TaxID=239 RepID=UPI002CAA15EC|nr:TonB-dependent receptor [Flavobacterium sp.]HSD06891.1 TonB-dependent receptor [Flavobacterium sp.]